MTDSEKLMVACRQAAKAYKAGEIPIGAAVFCGDNLVALARNRISERKDPTAHAELLAIREATETIGNERLTDCELFTTLEPCMMCSGAIIFARLKRVVYIARDEKMPALRNLLMLPGHNHYPAIEQQPGSCRASLLLSRFFRERRRKRKSDSA